jgi:sialate O-acetylesterase
VSRRVALAAVTAVLMLCWSASGVRAAAAAAALKLPFLFADNAVLQHNVPVPVWGEAGPGQQVRVEFAGQARTATAGDDGHWTLKLDPLQASSDGRPLTVTAGGQSITLKNVLVGEVWLCSGQSNMAKPLGLQGKQKPTLNYEQEIAAADYPAIRLLTVGRQGSAPAGVERKWTVCTPASVDQIKFSAVGYFFARQIHRQLRVPVGMIEASVGGTRIEAWTSPEGFAQVASLHKWAEAAKSAKPAKVQGIVPSTLYRRLIAPAAGYALRGALWYQGEANVFVDDGSTYTDKMRALIGGWRDAWGQREIPFYFVQLAPYRYSARAKAKGRKDALPRLWEAQAKALEIPNTAMVVTTDLVDDVTDIHPVRKREVGERLAACALARDYGRSALPYRGPTGRDVSLRGGVAVVAFDHADGGLKSRDGKPLTDFALAGADGHFVPAEARITDQDVVVRCPRVPEPKFVRFAWSEEAMPNLVNGIGLPAVPFRTDQLTGNEATPGGAAAEAAGH